jgi:HicA toxin of bacterial toxin-antitoxin,
MAQLQDELASFMSCSGPYRWKDLRRLLERLGYEQKKAGKTTGSRRKYYNSTTGHLIMLDEPHDGEMRPGMVKRLQKELQDRVRT